MVIRIRKKDNGFTLIEVLISVLILGLGILGVLNLQVRALMDNQDAYLRTQAIFMAYDMSDRIRANADIWQNAIDNNTINNITLNDANGNATGKYFFCSAYDPAENPAVLLADPLATPNACTDLQMAQYDVYRWKTDVGTILNGGTVKIERSADANSSNAAADIIRLTISWSRVNQEMQSKLNNASYSLDVRP